MGAAGEKSRHEIYLLYGQASRRLLHVGYKIYRLQYHEYALQKGLDATRKHARDILLSRLAPAVILNDGRQTPTKGHPVFIAQHACALCCRGCMSKWYKVKKGVALTPVQIEKCVNLLMAWIEKELNKE